MTNEVKTSESRIAVEIPPTELKEFRKLLKRHGMRTLINSKTKLTYETLRKIEKGEPVMGYVLEKMRDFKTSQSA